MDPFIGEIKIVGFNFAPRGWATCDGQLLPINQNQALFSLLGTTYGGNGQNNFALPNFQGRAPMHVGNGHNQGQVAGAATVALTAGQIPSHTHSVAVVDANGNVPGPSGALPARLNNTYRPAGGATTTLHPNSITAVGSTPHENMQPYLGLMFIIALQGVFPSRN